MLYDNAQLARIYLHGWQVTGNEFFRTITEEILSTWSGEWPKPTALLELAGFTNNPFYVHAHQALAQMQGVMAQHPLGTRQWLQALAYALSNRLDIRLH
jgi:uncharacterized protein YyaL (SSP411 family)